MGATAGLAGGLARIVTAMGIVVVPRVVTAMAVVPRVVTAMGVVVVPRAVTAMAVVPRIVTAMGIVVVPRAVTAVGLATVVTCALVGCGRMDFDARSKTDGSVAGDTAATADSAVPPGAVLWAPMESINGTNIDDIAGAHIILCNQVDCPTPVAGKRGGALEFPGTGPLFVEARADLDPTAGFTVAAWIKLDAYSGQGYSCIASKPVGTGSLDSYSLCVQDDMMSLFYTANGNTDDYLRGPTVPLGEWHHLAMTWDGTTKHGYYDGVQIATDVVTVTADATPVKLAGDVNSGANVYMVHGALDEVMIYGRALDATEVPQLVR